MIVEMRTYRIKIGAMPAYMKAYQEKGLAVQTRVLGHMVGWYTTEVGELNQVVHMWAYKDLNDRAERRARLFQEPEWLEYLAASRPFLEHQENKLLNPAPWMKLPPS
jgi:hypothetical protein